MNVTSSDSTSSLPFCLEDESFHVVSHIGFAMLSLSYMMRDAVQLRVCIALSNVVLVLWGILALPKWSCVSTAIWNSLFFLINVQRAIGALKERKARREEAGDVKSPVPNDNDESAL